MAKTSKKRGQKLAEKVSITTLQLSESSKQHVKDNVINRIHHIQNIRLLIFEWILMVSALIMLAITQAFWYGDSYAEDVFTEGGTYSEATLGSVGSLNPLFALTDSEKTLSRLLFATLTETDYSGHPGVGLAETIIPSDNGKTWSDGEPITNEDVLFSVDLIKNPVVKSIYDNQLINVVATEGEAGEIVFTLPTPYADFISALNFPVLPKHKLENADPKTLVEDDFSTSPVTSGPFNFNAIQSATNKEERVFYLSSNPNYYKGKPLLNNFAVHTYPDKDTLINALNAGIITATAELSDADSEEVTSTQLIKKNSGLNSGIYLFFNTKRESVANTEMRQAIRAGLDMTELREVAPELSALDYPLLPSQINIETYPTIPAHDSSGAKAKISELTGNTTIPLEIATLNTGYLPEAAHDIASQLNNLGFQTNVTIYNDQDQDFITQRNYDLLVFEIDLGADPDLLPYYHSSHAVSSGINLSNYRSSLADDLLLGARDTLDDALRAKKYERFLNYWVNDVPAIGLFQSNLTYYYNKNARTFSDSISLVTPFDRYADITEWAVNKSTKSRTP